MGVVTIDRTFAELVTEMSVMTDVEFRETVGDLVPVLPKVESVETDAVGISDVVGFVWIMLEVGRLVVSFGDDGR